MRRSCTLVSVIDMMSACSAAGPALASGERALVNITEVGSVVGGPIAGSIESVARNGYDVLATCESC